MCRLLFFSLTFVLTLQVGFCQKTLMPCHEGDFWGYCNDQGEIIIKQEYQKAFVFNGEIAPVVRDDGYWWFINKKGHIMFNSKRWADQQPMEPTNGLYKVEYFDPIFANVSEFYSRKGLPVKVENENLQGDTIPYKIFNFREAMILAKSKLGTPYGADGMDCSGFIRYIFNPFGIVLPYYANEISGKGRAIKLKDIEIGDLVFFAGSNQYDSTVNHVGFVISKTGTAIEFIHASSSKGVSINKLSDSYYKLRFLFARKIFG